MHDNAKILITPEIHLINSMVFFVERFAEYFSWTRIVGNNFQTPEPN